MIYREMQKKTKNSGVMVLLKDIVHITGKKRVFWTDVRRHFLFRLIMVQKMSTNTIFGSIFNGEHAGMLNFNQKLRHHRHFDV